jgi:hypothetical protein
MHAIFLSILVEQEKEFSSWRDALSTDEITQFKFGKRIP